jgi:hypothetical protein
MAIKCKAEFFFSTRHANKIIEHSLRSRHHRCYTIALWQIMPGVDADHLKNKFTASSYLMLERSMRAGHIPDFSRHSRDCVHPYKHIECDTLQA